MTQQTYIYRLPSGDASIIEPLTSSGFFEISAPSFSKNHLLKALAEALTLLHKLNQPVLESHQQNTSVVPANEQTQPSVGTVACAGEARPYSHPENTLQMLDCFRFLFGIDTANGQYQDILFDVIRNHLTSNSINFNDLTIAEIRSLMFISDDVFDHLVTSFLSTESVPAVSTAGEARPYSEPPTHDAYGAMFEAVTCINCDRWAFEPLLSENGIHLTCLHCHHKEWLGFCAQLSTESVDKAGE